MSRKKANIMPLGFRMNREWVRNVISLSTSIILFNVWVQFSVNKFLLMEATTYPSKYSNMTI